MSGESLWSPALTRNERTNERNEILNPDTSAKLSVIFLAKPDVH